MFFKSIQWDITTCMFTDVDADGFPDTQPAMYGGDQSGATPAETHHFCGFMGRPLDPDGSGLGAQMLLAIEGNNLHGWPMEDPRVIPILPTLKKGGSVQYCAKGGFGLFDGDDDTYTLYVPTAFTAGKPTRAHVFTVGLDANGKEVVNLMHAGGARITMPGDAKNTIQIANSTNTAWIVINDDGIEFNGNTKLAGNFGAGPQMVAWMAGVEVRLLEIATLLNVAGPVVGAPGLVTPVGVPPVPAVPPVSLTA